MADEVKENELLVLAEKKPEKGERWNKPGWKLRVVQWIYARKGKNVSPGEKGQSTKLEKRQFYFDDEGEIRMGKAEGFDVDDMNAIKASWAKIIALLTCPPAIVTETPKEPEQKPPEEISEDVPF